jgi:15-cis-phytoene synthase
MTDGVGQVIHRHSKSFALASRLLPPVVRDEAAIVYAFCRRADDAIDDAPIEEQPARLAALRAELDDVYRGAPMADPILAAFQGVVAARRIPREYPDELLAGMAMDAAGHVYEKLDDLLRYAFRVAGTVGLMMCHVMGVRRDLALTNATHLGVAMQLTNVCRDVAEDWGRGRLYLPRDLLDRAGAPPLAPAPRAPIPREAAPALARVVAELLALADRYYRSGDAGLSALGARSALGVRAARLIYSRIGAVLARRGFDPLSGRAVVSTARKLWLVARAAVETLARALRARGPLALPRAAVGYSVVRLDEEVGS